MDIRKRITSILSAVLLFILGLFLLFFSRQSASKTSIEKDFASESSEENAAAGSDDTFEPEALVLTNGSSGTETVSDEDSQIAVTMDDPIFTAPYSYAVFSSSDIELTLYWEDAVFSREIESELTDAIAQFDSEDYRVSFLLYDLTNGNGISYHPTDSYYSASVIKGPYAACVAETFPGSIEESEYLFIDTIQLSDNDAYTCLWNIYGPEAFETWVSEAGCQDIHVSDIYTDVTAQNLALMWVKMYRYFSSGTPESEWFSGLYTDTLNSCIAESLNSTYTVYSKAGWIFEDDYYNVQNDAGIVMSNDHPYVIVVLSDAYERMDLLDHLIASVDNAHTYLVENY